MRYNDVENAILDYLSSLNDLNDSTLTKHINSMLSKYEDDNSNMKTKKQMSEHLSQKEKELKTKRTSSSINMKVAFTVMNFFEEKSCIR